MRGIDEETLLAVRKSLSAEGLNTDVIDALISLKIRELNPWLPLDEFLKSGFEGVCWIARAGTVSKARFVNNEFFYDCTGFSINSDQITHVMPIHKPEPPR